MNFYQNFQPLASPQNVYVVCKCPWGCWGLDCCYLGFNHNWSLQIIRKRKNWTLPHSLTEHPVLISNWYDIYTLRKRKNVEEKICWIFLDLMGFVPTISTWQAVQAKTSPNLCIFYYYKVCTMSNYNQISALACSHKVTHLVPSKNCPH